MPQAVKDGIIVVLIISGPLVAAAALIGLVVGILQAATQVQEQTLGSALKIIGVFALIIIGGFWMFQYLNQYTSRTLSTAFTIVPNRTQKVVPKNSKEGGDFGNQFNNNNFNIEPPEKIKSNLPEGGSIPSSIEYPGKPSTPKIPPSASKILPPSTPNIPSQPIAMPNIPISDFQEPISFPTMEQQSDESNIQMQTDDFPPLNLVPGDPIKKQITNPDLTQREEIFSNNNTKEKAIDDTGNQAIESWLE